MRDVSPMGVGRLHRYWSLIEAHNAYLYSHDSVTGTDHGPYHGRDVIRRYLNTLPARTVVITCSANNGVLDAAGASNFEKHSRGLGKESTLIYVERPDGKPLPIYNWSGWLPETNWSETITILYALQDLIEAMGIRFSGSPGRMAVEMLRGCLDQPISFRSEGMSPRVYKGARIEEKPALASLYDATRWDIVGAYGWAMSHRPMPLVFQKDSRPNHRLEGEGVALAHVIPREVNTTYVYSPVPTGYRKNLRTDWSVKPVTVYLPYVDLRLARDYGAKVSVLESYTATEFLSGEANYHLRQRIEMLRTHPMGKKIVNALWGAMIATPGKSVWRYLNDSDKRKTRKIRKATKKRPTYVTSSYASGGHVAGLVRAKLFREGLATNPCILCHTDGMVILDRSNHLRDMDIPLSSNSFRPSGICGERLGEWRNEGILSQLHVGTAQHYTYIDPATGERRFVWAGDVPPNGSGYEEIRELRTSERISSYETMRAALRYKPENWTDQWIAGDRARRRGKRGARLDAQ